MTPTCPDRRISVVESVDGGLHARLQLPLLALRPPVLDVERRRGDPEEADCHDDRKHARSLASCTPASTPRRACAWPRPRGRGHRLPSTQSAGRAVTCTETLPLSQEARSATMPVVVPSFDLYETSESPRSSSSSEKSTLYCSSANRSLYSL